jgi:TonB family protein
MQLKRICFGLLAITLAVAPISKGIAFEGNSSIVENQSTDQRAQFPGGKEELKKWLKENMDYPEDAKRYGTVVIDFVVKKNGKLDKFKVHKGVNEDLDILAVEILRGMPKWEPATKNGKAIDSNVQLPVKFIPKSVKGDLD